MSRIHEEQALKQAFEKAYAALNEAQKKAVDTIDGPVMVIAGPGTGKTQILTLRIANILLQTDTPADGILALTFTEAGAKAMRERLRRYIGARAYQVPIYTFHGFSEKLIREYPDAYPYIIGGRPASELEKIAILETIIDGGSVKVLRPAGDPSYYVGHILRIINDLKKEYIGPDQLVSIVDNQEAALLDMEKVHQKGAHKGKVKGDYTKAEKVVTKNRELVFIYRQYEAMLRAQRLYDFEDMILQTVDALRTHEDMVRDLQEKYLYFLADEHQDVNGSQNLILELLAKNPFHARPNIFVVGDEKQAIYRFQGASLENFLYFKEQFAGTTEIQLTENYRSGQVILDAAHSLVAVESGPLQALRIPLVAKSVPKSVVSSRTFSHQAVEDQWLVSAVAAEIKAGVPAEEIAVIVRTNREVEALATLLRRAGIGVEASADGDILEHHITHTIEALLQAVVEQNEISLVTVLHGSYWGLAANDVFRILAARSYSQTLREILASTDTLTELGLSSEAVAAAHKVSVVLEEARTQAVLVPPHRTIETLLVSSGLLDHLIQHNALESQRVVRRLYDEVEALVLANKVSDIASVIQMFARTRQYNVALTAPYITTTLQAVQVMTAHKSKGLEFQTVFVPHLQDSIWGGSSKKTYFDIPLQKHQLDKEADPIDDEKRLLYVAMTRAKSSLFFSGSEINAGGKVLVPSRLCDEIDSSFVVQELTNQSEEEFSPVSLFTRPLTAPIIDTQLLLHALRHRGFSATSFNNYLRNPWDFVYLNVLRIPKVQETHLQFGTAVHSVLEYTTKTYAATGDVPTVTQIKNKLEQALGRLPLSTAEFTRLHEQALTILVPYIEHMKGQLPAKTAEEFKINVVLPTGIPEFPELPLTGNLDRLDFDDAGRVVQVVDYKTGKPKTRNAIEGGTASDDGSYKRQLVFYALLLKLYGDERYRTAQAVLSFVQPTPKGSISEFTFIITDEEVEEMRAALIAAVAEIVSGQWQLDGERKTASEYATLIARMEEMQ